jgi:hypothetical protein
VGKEFEMLEEFAGIDFGSERLEKRFKKTMEKISKEPEKSIWLASGNRSEAKAVYRMLSNEKLNDEEILRQTAESTRHRIAESGSEVILAVQDTMGVNYDGHVKTTGIGWIGDKTLGVNVHSSIAVTPEGLTLGLLSQTSWTRKVRSDTSASRDKKKERPIEDKESYRWLETMESSEKHIPSGVKVIHICDRDGDMYELYEKASKEKRLFVIRILQNRVTVNSGKIIDETKASAVIGSMMVTIPRNSQKKQPEREATLNVRAKTFDVKKPNWRRNDKHLSESVRMTVIYISEEQPPDGIEPIKWLLATNESVVDANDAMKISGYYIQRWKIERFHYVMKSGCQIEKIQQRSVDKIITLILMYSVISIKILNMTYLARISPELPCDIIFGEDEWKILYCTVNKTQIPPNEPYTIAEAVIFIARLAGWGGAKSDGAPGLKVIWLGLSKLNFLLDSLPFFPI